MKNVLMIMVAVGALTAFSPIANATLLGTGGSCTSCSVFALPAGTDTLVASTGVQSGTIGSGGSGFSYDFESQVYKEAGGSLDFYYQFKNTGTTGQVIESMTIADFTGFLTDVGITGTDLSGFSGSSQAPLIIQRSTDAVLRFTYDALGFGAPVAAGTTVYTLVVRTNADAYTAGVASLQDGQTANLSAFQPSAIPEPGAILLFGTALAVTAIFMRRRFVPKA